MLFHCFVFATDNNHRYGAHFAINEATGLVTTRQPLQHLTEAEFTLKILARDRGRPSLVSSPHVLEVYVNATAPQSLPVVTSMSFAVREDADVGTVLGSVGSSATEFYIVDGNTYGSFGVDNSNGAIYVALPLRYDDCPSYSMTVQVVSSDASTPPNYLVIVNVSVIAVFQQVPAFDSALVFVAIRENVPIGSDVAQMSASLNGNRHVVRYFLSSQSPNGTWLSIDANTGRLKTASEIDRERVRQITVTVSASIGGQQSVQNGVSTATLVAMVTDVNDNAPVFERPNAVVNVSEDEVVGYAVTTVIADDPDLGSNGLVSYSLLAGNDLGHFQLDSATG
jgi:hypothetical protein